MEQTIIGVDLSPFVPRIATSWAAEAPELRSRTLDGSLVFADISGFTALSERLAKRGPIGAEELTGVLGECFAGLLSVAYAEGGGLLKFGGDALLLLFDGPGHELRATRAALGMRSAIRTVGRLQTSVGAVRLRMSQGVHSGEIDLYRVGGSHDELIICGPTASEVIRMETVADAGEIVVSQATAAALRHAAPAVLGEPKGPGVLLRARTLVHVVEGFPTAVSAPGVAARAVPVAVRDHLAAGGGDPEHRHVAIAFVHYDGTDGLRADEGTGAVADALDELVRVTQAASESEDVTFLATDIDKDGGKIILVSGTPTAHEDAEGRLLRVVRRIADAGTRLPVRIGVNRGHVFSGCVGPPYRQTYTVMGDAVNLAARLMAKAARGEIVVHPSVIELSRTGFVTAPMEPFLVKGKAAPIHAVTLGEVAGTQEARSTSKAPLVGRDAELRSLVDHVRAGVGSIEVTGTVGLGKTRLVSELREALRGEATVRIINCEPYEQATAYYAIRILLRHLLRAATPDELVEALEERAPRSVPLAPLIAEAMGLALADTATTARIAEKYRHPRRVVAIGALLRSVASDEVLVLDDAQWIDPASADVIRAVEGAATPGLRIVRTRRPDATAPLAPAPTIELQPLTPDDAMTLVRALTADAPRTPAVLRAIVERAGGNPLFAEELIRVSEHDDATALPNSLEAVVGAQIDALPPHDRRLLRFAAVLGESFEPSLLAEVMADDSLGRAEEVARRVSTLIVPTADGRCQFRHRLIRDVAYGALPFSVRRDLHARAAQVLERLGDDGDQSRAAVLSMHCLHAQQYERCWHHATRAAAHARRKGALAEAEELYERAVSIVRFLPDLERRDIRSAWVELSRVTRAAGKYKRAKEALDRARAYSSTATELAVLFEHQAYIAERTGNISAGVRWAHRGLRAIEGDTSAAAAEIRSSLLATAAMLRQQAGKYSEALRLARDASAVAAEAEHAPALAQAHQIIDWASTALGRAESGHAQLALDLYEELGELEQVAVMLLSMGGMAYYRGEWNEALSLYERSRQLFDEIGATVSAALGSGNIAEIFADQGKLDEAEALLTEAISTWRALRFPVGEALATRFLARVELRRGHPEAALAMFTEARRVLDESRQATKVLEIDVWIAECLLATGDVDGARRLLDSALAQERSTGSSEMRSMIHRLRACAAIASNDIATAWAEVDESLHVARDRTSPYDIAMALELMSLLPAAGRQAAASPVVDDRFELLAALGVARTPTLPVAAS